MNPWTALLIGLVLGWLIEFAIDWFFWRRNTSEENQVEELRSQLQAAEARIEELETGTSGSAGDEFLSTEDYDPDAELESSDEEFDAGHLATAAVAGAAIAEGDDELTAEESEIETAESLGEALIIEESELDEDIMALNESDFENDVPEELAAAGAAAAVVAAVDDETDEFAGEGDSDLVEEQAGTGEFEEEIPDAGEEFADAEEITAFGAVAAAEVSQERDSDVEEAVITEVTPEIDEEYNSGLDDSVSDDSGEVEEEFINEPESDENPVEADQEGEPVEMESTPSEEEFTETADTAGEGDFEQ